MYQVRKKSGTVEQFELDKVINSIQNAFKACDRAYQESIIEMIALKSIAGAEKSITNNILESSSIKYSIGTVLSNFGYSDIAKVYLQFGVDSDKPTVLDYKKVIDGYLDLSDWRVKENSSVDYSIGGLILSNSGAMSANYWLSEIYDREIADAHRNCEIHLHDLSMISGYCAGWSLKTLIKEGFGGVPKKTSSRPAKHLTTLCNQMINFLGCLQNEWSGRNVLPLQNKIS